MAALNELASDRRVQAIRSFDDKPALERITRFEAWRLLDLMGEKYPVGATRDQCVELLKRIPISRVIQAALVLEREQMAARARKAESTAPEHCIVCGLEILGGQGWAVGAAGRFHLDCAQGAKAPVPKEKSPDEMHINELRQALMGRGIAVEKTWDKTTMKAYLVEDIRQEKLVEAKKEAKAKAGASVNDGLYAP
jgi:hypothetical protein